MCFPLVLYSNFHQILTIILKFNISAIQQEKGQQQLIAGIESFDPTKLKHAETQEKNVLPTKEIIEEEKKA
jgi:hypothetical protein